MSAHAKFKQADVTRALIGARKGGMSIGSIEIEANGSIVIKAAGPSGSGRANSLDRLLKPSD